MDDLARMAEHIAELATHHPHTEKYYVWSENRNRAWKHHLAWHAPLVVQLRRAAGARTAGDQVRPGGKGKKSDSPAPANLDAVDRLQAIETAVVGWRLVLQLPGRGRLEDDLRALVGAAATATPELRAQLAADVDRWRLWCLTLTGWRSPPWRPNVPCPQCEKLPGDKAGLRVRLDRSTACCVSCGAAWGPDAVGVLAEYVRQWKEAHP